jgi:hypothetical protein
MLRNLFEEIKNNLRGHDGSEQGRLDFYETQISKGRELDKNERREYFENRGVGSIEDNEVYTPDGHSLLFLWTTGKYARRLPKNLEKIPKRFFTKDALLEKQQDTKRTALYNLYRYKNEHLVPDKIKAEEFLTSNGKNQNKPTYIGETILAELIEVSGIRAIPENLRTEEFLMKDRGGNYFTLVAEQGDLLKMPQSLVTLENLLNNKSPTDESLLCLTAKYGQLNDLPKDFYSKENLTKYKKEFVEALCVACSSLNPSATKESIPKELLTNEFLDTRLRDDTPNAIEEAARADKLEIIPPKILADSLSNALKLSPDAPNSVYTLDILTRNKTEELQSDLIPYFKKVLKELDNKSIKKIGEDYATLSPLIIEEQKNRMRISLEKESKEDLIL